MQPHIGECSRPITEPESTIVSSASAHARERWKKVQSSRLSPTPKTSTWGTRDRFDYPGKSWMTQMSSAEGRLVALLAEPAEEGAQVVMEATRCALGEARNVLGAMEATRCAVARAFVCAATLAFANSSPQESTRVECALELLSQRAATTDA